MSAFQKVEFDQGGHCASSTTKATTTTPTMCEQLMTSRNFSATWPRRNACHRHRPATSAISSIAYVTTCGWWRRCGAGSRTVRYATRCRLFAAGKCTFGAMMSLSSRYGVVLRSGDNSGRVRAPAAMEEADDQECGICMEMVAAKGERFGLLLGCVHAFCLHLYSRVARRCAAAAGKRRRRRSPGRKPPPRRRVRVPCVALFSPYVIPSVYFVADTERKLAAAGRVPAQHQAHAMSLLERQAWLVSVRLVVLLSTHQSRRHAWRIDTPRGPTSTPTAFTWCQPTTDTRWQILL
jgi:hypothetical protein